MKFGELLQNSMEKGWESFYIDYNKLKGIIKDLEKLHFGTGMAVEMGYQSTSLSVAPPTNAAAMPTEFGRSASSQITQEIFYSVIEEEMRKIEQFTNNQVKEIRRVLKEVDGNLSTLPKVNSDEEREKSYAVVQDKVEKVGETFLKLEKFVNLNVTGFHKILKKHDRRLPNPCKAFYVTRLHDQSWVRGDYSDVLVALSRAYSAIRGDAEVQEKETEKQDFVRSTRKYWVHTEDVSRIKYIILQHLPVFMQKTMGEQDSQLVNSVYLDNYSMELYHGRLQKSPGAIALRFRWYGTGTPEIVFVERKTHRESWCGEVSVKERFVVKEDQVQSLINGTFDLNAEIERMKAKGKSESDIKEWTDLATEVKQAISSKQLIPTLRTQYMRTAFQIPFDATVRISLDTNLCMVKERVEEVEKGRRWYRDPHADIPLQQITRFPHAILEVKLQLENEEMTPSWVTELIQSGMLSEVHKFSKFIHGSAVLLTEDVQQAPYWVDDVTLTRSIEASHSDLLKSKSGATQIYDHLLPHDASGVSKAAKIAHANSLKAPVRRAPDIGYHSIDDDCFAHWCDFSADVGHVTKQKEEPKLFFANERTFMKWLEMAVILSTISIAVLAFSEKKAKSAAFAMSMLVVAELFIAYALWTFLSRGEKIASRFEGRWDDPVGPILLSVVLIIALCAKFLYSL